MACGTNGTPYDRRYAKVHPVPMFKRLFIGIKNLDHWFILYMNSSRESLILEKKT